jgi:hypothetical protein
MEEALKILLAVGFGGLYFWLLSRRKPNSTKPNENTAPVTKVIKPVVKTKTTFAKVAAAIEEGKKQPLLTPNKDVSKNSLKNPTLLMRKDTEPELSLYELRKRKEGILAEKRTREGGQKRASEKAQDFKTESTEEDALNKAREKQYKLKTETEHPIMKILKDHEGAKNAIVIAEILNRKY